MGKKTELTVRIVASKEVDGTGVYMDSKGSVDSCCQALEQMGFAVESNMKTREFDPMHKIRRAGRGPGHSRDKN